MKVTNTGRPTATSRSGVVQRTASTVFADDAAPVAALSPVDSVNGTILGIPPEEMTEHVRQVMMTLIAEVEMLRRELERSQSRIVELEKLADTDTLSPIANRRAFVRELARVMNYAERYSVPTSLLFFDLNGLKQINDNYGHKAGDAALVHVAETLRNNIRASDIVGRLGGDEYAVILSHATEEQAQAKASFLIEKITEHPVHFEGINLPVSASVGVYTFEAGESPTEALAKADAQMYKNKRQSRSEDVA